jgi:hypothetical protein
LRGYDPVADHNALTRQAGGRRVIPGDPERSLLLQKTSLQIAHGGGMRLKKGSPDYQVVSRWIKAGAPASSVNDPKVTALQVTPLAATLKPGDKKQMKVVAKYSDGHTEDVTRWVKFGTSEGSVATVGDNGLVQVVGRGETAITIWFNSRVAFARIASPFPNAPAATAYAQSPRSNFIDDLVVNKLKQLGLPVSGQCSDSEFIRRATLDMCGVLPTPEAVRAFLADKNLDKRMKLVDQLMARPEFVDYWAYKWSDLLLVNSRKLPGRSLTAFYTWIRDSVQQNKPWDKFAREIVTATGSNIDNGAANFFVMHREPVDLTETTTQAFLGMSVMCARCHNHPLEKWTQTDYYAMANLYSRVRLKNGDTNGEVMVIAEQNGNINLPRSGKPLPPKPLDGKPLPLDDSADRRFRLAEWLTAPENPYFSKALVNRVWRNFMGKGLVDAEDDLRLTNPPSNSELLDALAKDFSKSGFDVKRLMRTIVASSAYQRSAEPIGMNAKDERFYSRYLVKRLPAEVMLDVVSQVTNVPTAFDGYARGTRALQLRDSQIPSYFLTAFGRAERTQTCSCERQDAPSVAQALHLANGETVNKKLKEKGSVVDRLILNEVDDADVIEEVYLSALSRYPNEKEKGKLLVALKAAPMDPLAPMTERDTARRALLEDLYWAVLTGNEFLFNH